MENIASPVVIVYDVNIFFIKILKSSVLDFVLFEIQAVVYRYEHIVVVYGFYNYR